MIHQRRKEGRGWPGSWGLIIYTTCTAQTLHTHTHKKKEFQTSPDAISIPRTNCVHYKCKVCVCMHPHVDYIQKLNRSLHSITVCLPLLYSPLFFSVGKEMYSKETYSYRSIDLSGTTQDNSLHDSMLSSCLLLLFLLSPPFFFVIPLFFPSIAIVGGGGVYRDTHYLWGCSGNRPSRSNKHLRLASCRKESPCSIYRS